MKEVILLIVWFSHAGVHMGTTDNWETCHTVMDALAEMDISASCHLSTTSIRPWTRP
jgi:NOL1/NOP2/fmu family ribosome biogenesis protein